MNEVDPLDRVIRKAEEETIAKVFGGGWYAKAARDILRLLKRISERRKPSLPEAQRRGRQNPQVSAAEALLHFTLTHN